MNSKWSTPLVLRLIVLLLFVLATCVGYPGRTHVANAHGDPIDASEVDVKGVNTSHTNETSTTNTAANTQQQSRTHLTAFAIRTFDAGDCAPAQSIIDMGVALQSPVVGEMSQPFGHGHAGVDWQGTKGDRIRAAHDGEVIFAGWSREGYGYLITVLYAPLSPTMTLTTPVVLKTHYAHLSQINVAVGRRVRAGQLIGEMGSTGNAIGPHLHFEVRLDSVAVNPMCFFEPENIRQDLRQD